MLAHVKPASWPLIASIGSIAISPLLVLATAQGALYNLWLAVMMIALWVAQRLTKREIGIAVGDPKSYLIALAYAVGIIGCVALGAWAAQLIDLKDYSATTAFRRLTLNFLVTFVLALVTGWNLFTYWAGVVVVTPGMTYRQAMVATESTTAVANTVPGGGAIAVGLTYAMFGSWGFSKSRTTLW